LSSFFGLGTGRRMMCLGWGIFSVSLEFLILRDGPLALLRMTRFVASSQTDASS
jgi:hypothetical protein